MGVVTILDRPVHPALENAYSLTLRAMRSVEIAYGWAGLAHYPDKEKQLSRALTNLAHALDDLRRALDD